MSGETGKSGNLAPRLRQMLAVLETERRALGAMDVDTLLLAANDKQGLCSELEQAAPASIDAECRGLLEAARHQNEVNRKVRNLLAANVASRLEALTRSGGTYSKPAIRHAV